MQSAIFMPAALPNTSVFARAMPARTAALNAGTYISMVNTVIAASTAHTGRVKNGVKSPFDRVRPRRRLLSRMSPRTRPRTNGGTG